MEEGGEGEGGRGGGWWEEERFWGGSGWVGGKGERVRGGGRGGEGGRKRIPTDGDTDLPTHQPLPRLMHVYLSTTKIVASVHPLPGDLVRQLHHPVQATFVFPQNPAV